MSQLLKHFCFKERLCCLLIRYWLHNDVVYENTEVIIKFSALIEGATNIFVIKSNYFKKIKKSIDTTTSVVYN